MIKGKNLDEIYIYLSNKLLKYGTLVSPRDLNTFELLDVSLLLTNPKNSFLTLSSRGLSKSYAHGEFIWYYTGNNKLDFMQYYSKRMKQFSDDGLTLAGAYGPKIKKSFPRILMLLRKDKFSRQAVISLFDNNNMYLQSKDVPCTTTLHFLVRNNKLDLFVNMRSNDFYLGLPYDIFSFSMFQLLVAYRLNLPVGCYHHHIDSLHYYEKDKKKVIRISQDRFLENRNEKKDQGDFIKNIGFMSYCESKIRKGEDFCLPSKISKSLYCMEVIKEWKKRKKVN